MGLLGEIFSGAGGVSGTSYRDSMYEGKQSDDNGNKKEKRIYEESRVNAPLTPYPPLSRVEQVTLSLGWNGSEMVVLPKCGDCRSFAPDTINPREGVGHCRAFPAIGNQDKLLIRYPTNSPKNESCFERKPE